VLAVLFFAVVLTASRMGIALLPLVLAGVWLMYLQVAPERGRRRFAPAIAALAAVPLVAFAALLAGNTALGHVAERFIFTDDPRRELWRDAWFAITQAWPFGVGVGAAQPALIAAERLEVLDPTFPNRAHNDYLELALESGLIGLALLAAIAAVLAAAAWRSWRERPAERHLTVLGGVIVLVTALHSFVDYPLRSMALACLMGTGAGLLMGTPRKLATNEPSA
jgi:O-antigen ligase